jgi:hypothetical protein
MRLYHVLNGEDNMGMENYEQPEAADRGPHSGLAGGASHHTIGSHATVCVRLDKHTRSALLGHQYARERTAPCAYG